ncbi:unnamed protein product [Zymoseptoria tritici ST99CH_3D1]|nr:unnamed protein product [Zymoseptoria tritici ST99CH_3D1]
MVFFRTNRPNSHADYWKIPATDQDERSTALKAIIDQPGGKQHYTTATTRYRLVELAARTHRGLRCYDGDSVQELKQFVSQRGLVAALATSRVKKLELMDLLETADEDATFDRFSELPPELRTLIYELHFEFFLTFDNFGSINSASPPPITHVNSQIRQETMQLFYATCHFDFGFDKPGLQRRVMASPTNILRHLPREAFSAVRNFCVCLDDSSGLRYVECSVNLVPGTAKLSIMYLSVCGPMKKAISPDPLEEEVRKFFAEDFVRVWPPMLTVEIADTLFSLARKSDPDRDGDESEW